MKKKVVAKKGYTIEVVSWENDGDNYKTNYMTVNDKEYAVAILKMCETLFSDGSNNGPGIGNMMDDEHIEAKSIILDYVADKPIITKGNTDEDKIVDIVRGINYNLMGSSEWYYSRVFESGTIFYTPEDISVEEIANTYDKRTYQGI